MPEMSMYKSKPLVVLPNEINLPATSLFYYTKPLVTLSTGNCPNAVS